ncbi:hypothetical protein DAI22_10g144301 [Oryza sativa Japonica Group]|nr:hypothetical protein DAI22_10g144301 [Oryza sativa Japonica Group]
MVWTGSILGMQQITATARAKVFRLKFQSSFIKFLKAFRVIVEITEIY